MWLMYETSDFERLFLMICNNDYVTIWLYYINARQWFHNNINVKRKCTRRDLWDGDICDFAAI